MYFLHRLSSIAPQPSIDALSLPPDSQPAVFNNATNRLRQNRKGRSARYPTFSLPSKKASATVCLSNAVVSAERVHSSNFPSLESLLPSPSGLPEPVGSPPSSVPFPSSAPISLSCPSKYDDDFSTNFRTGSFSEPSSPASDSWPADLRRKRAKSCLASSYVHRDTHDPFSLSGEQCGSLLGGYGSDTEAGFSVPGVRRRKLGQSWKKGGSTKRASKGKTQQGRRGPAIDVQFVATMHRSISCHLNRVRESKHTRTCSGTSTSSAYTGIAEDEDVIMADADDVLSQDELLVERLSRILADQGFSPNRSRLSPPHELMSGLELKSPPLRLPAVSPPPSYPPPSPPSDLLDVDPFCQEVLTARVDLMDMDCPSVATATSSPLPIPFPLGSCERDSQPQSSVPQHGGFVLSPPLPQVLNFPCPPPAHAPSMSLPSPPPPLPLSPPQTPKRPSHKRRHSHDEIVLDVSQLVATLHLRYKDRAATRPRSRSVRTAGIDVPPPRVSSSPLSKVVFSDLES